MIQLTISFDFNRKHRMPQFDYNHQFIKQEEEKEVWLRVPIQITNEYYSLSFFIQSKINIQNFENEEKMWILTTQLFTELLSNINSWNILDMQDFYLSSTLEIDKSKEKLFIGIYEITINKELHNYLLETSQKILKVQEILDKSIKYLSDIIEYSSSYGFHSYKQGINECINFLGQCSRSISEHGEKVYFDKQLHDIKMGFRELIKRKRINNERYQQYLNTTSIAVFRLPIPNEWCGHIPVGNENLLDFLEE